jgi:hypothetical protein
MNSQPHLESDRFISAPHPHTKDTSHSYAGFKVGTKPTHLVIGQPSNWPPKSSNPHSLNASISFYFSTNSTLYGLGIR